MPNQIVTARPLVTVDGSSLGDQVREHLLAVLVETSRTLPALVELTFADEDRTVIGATSLKVGSQLRVQVQTNETSAPVTLVDKVEVVSLEAEIGPEGSVTVVRGYELTYRLMRHGEPAAFQKMTLADIASKLAGACGLTVDATGASAVLEHVLQTDQSDWELLHQLADVCGLEVASRGNAVVLRAPTTASGPAAAGARDDPTVLERGANLLRVHVTSTASGLVPSVEVRGWSPTTKAATVGTASVSAKGVATSLTPGPLAGRTSASPTLVSAPHLSTASLVKSRATLLADRLGESFAEIDGTATGNPALKAGTVATLKGLGAPFDGAYVLSTVVHRFDGSVEGYTCEFRVSGTADRSTWGVTGPRGGGGSGGSGSAVGALRAMPAVVTNNDDGEGKLGRVRVKLPTISDRTETGWADVVSAGAGSRRGLTITPEVNDLVLAVLPADPLAPPWVIGGLYNGKDAPPWAATETVSGGKVVRTGLVSRSGTTVRLEEQEGKERVVVALKGEKDAIILSTSPRGIQVVTDGTLEITAKQDATLTSEAKVVVKATSDVSVKGMNIALEATQNLTLKGAKVAITGQAAVEASAPSVKVAGTGTAELSSSGVTTVRGTLVKIN